RRPISTPRPCSPRSKSRTTTRTSSPPSGTASSGPMSNSAEPAAGPVNTGPARPRLSRLLLAPADFLGVVPFLLFALLFLALPTLFLIMGAFQDASGNFTFDNILALSDPQI